MFRVIVPLAALALSFVFSSHADALSCQRRIVSRGESQLRVQQLCGEPSSRIESIAQRSSSQLIPGPGGQLFLNTQSISVSVERWLYDFGPRRLMQELTFEDGVLVNLRTRSYGTQAGLEARERSESGKAERQWVRKPSSTLAER